MCLGGLGVEKDEKKAMEWTKKMPPTSTEKR